MSSSSDRFVKKKHWGRVAAEILSRPGSPRPRPDQDQHYDYNYDLGYQIDVVYTDFEKAFDKIPHKGLIM